MPLNDVAVVGGANMDVVARTDVLPLAGDSTPGRIHCSPGGVARNMAENLARLGHLTHLISAVGDDVFGANLLAATAAAGVDTSAFKVLPGHRSATYLSVHGLDGDMNLAINDMALLEAVTPDFLRGHEALLRGAAGLVLDCNLPAPTLAWLLSQPWGNPVFVDGVSVLKCQRVAGWLACIHTLKLNRLEAQALSGMPVHSPVEAGRAAAALHRLGVRNVVVSLGEMGVSWCDEGGEVGFRPAGPVTVVNTSGAGDALLAGLVHAQLAGMPLRQALPFGMACAELTLSSTFANNPALCVSAVMARQAEIAPPL